MSLILKSYRSFVALCQDINLSEDWINSLQKKVPKFIFKPRSSTPGKYFPSFMSLRIIRSFTFINVYVIWQELQLLQKGWKLVFYSKKIRPDFFFFKLQENKWVKSLDYLHAAKLENITCRKWTQMFSKYRRSGASEGK